MSTVNFSGVGTGIDWSQIIDFEISSRREAVIEPIEKWRTSWEEKISAYETVSSLLGDLQEKVEAMDTVGELLSYGAVSTDDDTVSAQAGSSANAGTYTIEVNSLALSETEAHSGAGSADTVVNNTGSAGTFAYTYGETTVSLEVLDGMTLSDLVDLINNSGENPGVTASLLDDGSGSPNSQHLILRGQDTGEDYTLSVDGTATTLEGEWSLLSGDAAAGGNSVTVADASLFHQYQAVVVHDDDSEAEYHLLDAVAGNSLTLRESLAADFTLAQNAYVTPQGIGSAVSAASTAGESTIAVADASYFRAGSTVIIADGTGYEELTISAVDTGTNTLTFTTDLLSDYAPDAYVTQLEGGRKFAFTESDFQEIQTAANAQFRFNGYPPTGWIEREENVVTDVIEGVTLTLKNSTGASPVTVTVESDPEGVKTKIEEWVDAYNAVRRYLNAETSYDPETGESGVLLANYGAEMVESLLRSIVVDAPPGFGQGTDTYVLLGEVGINAVGAGDGDDLGTLEIDEGELDAALSEDFRAVVRLFSSDYAGYSNSSYLSFYDASEMLTTPGIYNVEVDFDGSGNVTAARIKLDTEDEWRAMDVSDGYVSGTSGNPEHGLYVRTVWDGSSTTQSATVRLTQGVAGRMGAVVNDILDPEEGLIHNLNESYSGIIDQIDDRIEREEDRLELLRERLLQKYARLEQMLTQMQSTQSSTQSLSESLLQL